MGTIFDSSKTADVTIDESLGLQTSGTPTSTEDNNDNDILLSTIDTLLSDLQGMGAPTEAIEAAQNRVLTFLAGATPELSFRLFDGPDSNGSDPLPDSELSNLTTTAGEDPITLVRMSNTVIFGYANYGEADARVAFALVLQPIAPTTGDPGGANITIVQYEALHHPDGTSFDEAVNLSGLVSVDAVEDVTFDDFGDAPAGQNDWISVTDDASDIQILVTGLKLGVDTVNTSEFALGSNSQSIVINDGLVFDFVKGQTAPTQTTADDIKQIDFSERVEGPSAGFTLVQTGGPASNRVGAQITAYDSSELGGAYADGAISAPSQTIVSVEVWNGSTKVSTWSLGGSATGDANLTYDSHADGSVTIQGLLVHYRVEFHVGVVDGDDTGKLDRFSVKNVSSGGQANDTFDLGHISLGGQVSDHADIGSHLRFEDDGPHINPTGTEPTLTVDETDLTANATQNFAANFSSGYGADGAGTLTYALGVKAEASGLTDTATNEAVNLSVNGSGVVEGRTATTNLLVFTVSVAANGDVTLDQKRAVVHTDTTNPDDTATLSSDDLVTLTATITDKDGDHTSATLNIGQNLVFHDDGPRTISPEHAHVNNAAGDPVGPFLLDEDLHPSSFADNFGQDGPGVHDGVVFTGTNGALLKDTGDHTLTSNGVDIHLFGFGTNVLTAYAGTTDSAPKVFTITLDGSTGHYSVDMDATIDNGSLSFSNFGSGGAGLRYWLGVAGDQVANRDLLITGGDPLTNPVNNDSDDIAIGNQWIDPTEVVRIDLVDSITSTGGSSSLTGIPQPAHHFDGNDVGFTVMQTKANSLVDVQIRAIDAARDISGTTSADIRSDLLDGSTDHITSVTVINGGTEHTYTSSAAGVVTFNADGTVTVFNLNAPSADTRDQVFVSTDNGFSRLEVMNADTNKQDALAIGGFEVAGHAGAPVDIALNVNVVDGDGDTAIGVVGVTFDPPVV